MVLRKLRKVIFNVLLSCWHKCIIYKYIFYILYFLGVSDFWYYECVGLVFFLNFQIFSGFYVYFELLGTMYSGPDWCGSFLIRMVAVSSVIKRFVWLVERLKIVAFAGYLWLVDYKILQRFNNKLPLSTYYNI